MVIFDATQGPVTLASVEKGALFEVFQALQGEKPVGAIRFDWTRGGAFLKAIVGHGHGAYVAPYARLLETIMGQTERATIFTDLWDMPTYDSFIRTGMTQHALKYRAKEDASYVLLQSKLVAMGVSVMGLAMGGIIQSFTKRADFESLVLKHGLPTRRPMPR